MQESDWADLMTKAPSRTVARYQPSSPRARLDGLQLLENNTLQSATSRLAQTQHSQVTKRGAMGRAREPQAATGQQREVSRSASQSKESLPHQSHHATAPRESKTSHIWCGNNILSPKLRRNGGNMEIGSPSQCFRKGVGVGFYQEIDPAHLGQFLADNSGPYKRYIEQPLFYGDGPVPAGKIRATLSQCRSRGFGVGAVRRAKKILKERRHGMSRA